MDNKNLNLNIKKGKYDKYIISYKISNIENVEIFTNSFDDIINEIDGLFKYYKLLNGNTDLNILNIPVRIKNILLQNNFTSLEEVAEKGYTLWWIKGLGKKSIPILKEICIKNGLKFND